MAAECNDGKDAIEENYFLHGYMNKNERKSHILIVVLSRMEEQLVCWAF